MPAYHSDRGAGGGGGGGGRSSSVVGGLGLVIERSKVRVPAGAAGEFSSPAGSTFCADSYFGIRSPLCYRSNT